MIIRTLELPGAWLAGFLFALHPVCVEAVAWISEQKSTLSTVFYLSAALIYLHFDRTRRRSQYFLAFGLFIAALLSKTVTATLPAALLVVFWWKRGRIDWKRDVLPLLPWFAIGAAAGLFTAYVERKFVGAEGADYALTLRRTLLLAGRVIWFYLGKTGVAGEPDVRLSTLENRPRQCGGNTCFHWEFWRPRRYYGWYLPNPRGDRLRVFVFRGNAVPCARIFQCLSVHLFLRRRSLSVPGELRNHRAGCVWVSDGGWADAGASRVGRAGPDSRRPDLASERNVSRCHHALSGNADPESGLLDGSYEPRNRARN